MPLQEKEELIEFLKRNIDVFAWDACDAPGIDPSFICHHLNVNPAITPKKQPPRRSSKEHADAIRDEVAKLKRVGAIKEVFLPPMVGQYRGGQEEKWKMMGLCGLHGPKQSMPKRPVPYASNRPADGCNSRPSSDELLRCLSRLSSNTTSLRGSGEDSLHDTDWELPLQGNAIWSEERRVHLSKDDDKNVRAAVGQEHRNLCR